MSMVNALASERKPRIHVKDKATSSNVQALGTLYQIHGGMKIMTMEETRKRANDNIDFIPEVGFDGEELLPQIPNVIVAEAVWPRICQGSH